MGRDDSKSSPVWCAHHLKMENVTEANEANEGSKSVFVKYERFEIRRRADPLRWTTWRTGGFVTGEMTDL
jgi:hypothetical protein